MDVLKVTTLLWMWFAVNLPFTAPVLQGSPRKDIPVRLVDGLSLFHGWAEVLVDGQWGGVCGDGWGMNDAKVLCRQLGSPGVLLTFTGSRTGGDSAGAAGSAGAATGAAASVGQLDCRGSEAGLADCRRRPKADCSKRRAAARCLATTLPVRSKDVVEMLYDRNWLPVCQRTESVAAAQVLCRQLGLPHLVRLSAERRPLLSPSLLLPPSSPPSDGVSGGGGNDDKAAIGRLSLDLACDGQETGLAQCPSKGPRDSWCPAARVVCSKEDSGEPGGFIRLSETEDAGATGRLLVGHRDQWWPVCSQGFGLAAATLACRQLGYRSATAVRPRMAVAGAGRDGFDRVSCQGDEASLEECRHTLDASNVCPSETVAAITCNNTEATILPDYRVRLVGGSFPYEGRVEVSIAGRWGTVCDDGWGYADADVVCQQLGYYAAEAVASTAYFGEGAGPILLDDVACLGNESTLADCPHAGPGQHNCNHKEDAGVRCYENKTMFTLLPSEKNDSILPLIVILINGLIALLILFGCLIYCYLKIWDRYTGRAQRAAEHRRVQGAGWAAGVGDSQGGNNIPLEFTEEPPPYHTVQQNRSVYIAQRPETPPPEYSEAMKLQAEGCV